MLRREQIGFDPMKHATQSGSDPLGDVARLCEEHFRTHGLNIFARVRDSDRAMDLALSSTAGDVLTVVRCVVRIEPADYRALRTMLIQGDFNGAALVYTAEEQPHLSSEIPSYPLARIDELAASLFARSAK